MEENRSHHEIEKLWRNVSILVWLNESFEVHDWNKKNTDGFSRFFPNESNSIWMEFFQALKVPIELHVSPNIKLLVYMQL